MNNEHLLNKMIYPIGNTNKIFFDYSCFKQFAIKENYCEIILHSLNTIKNTLVNHSSFEMHINLFSFNTSSFAKYKDFICIFTDSVFTANTDGIYEKINCFVIYFTPSIMDVILSVFSHSKNSVKPYFVFHSKKDSATELSGLLQ